MQPLIILMNGFTACFKSTISNYLSQLLLLKFISSHQLGSASTSTGLPDNNLRDIRYQKMLTLLKNNISKGKSSIVDFSFCHKDTLLKTIYLLNKQNVRNVKIIRLISSNTQKSVIE